MWLSWLRFDLAWRALGLEGADREIPARLKTTSTAAPMRSTQRVSPIERVLAYPASLHAATDAASEPGPG